MNAEKIIYSTGDPAFAVDRKGEIVTLNRAAESAFGYSAAAAEGQLCWNLLRGRDPYKNDYCGRDCPLQAMAFRGKSVNNCKIIFKLASGETSAFMVSTLVLHNGPGDKLIAHLCRPEIQVSTKPVAQRSATQPSNNHKRGALTLREKEVLALIAEGKSTREIASVMCISVYTVRNHIGHILFKLHAHSRLEAVSLARRLHLT